MARPTVDLFAAVQGEPERVLEALEAGVQEGVVELDDSRLRFAHPLLASVCYERARLWKRRAVHGRSRGRLGHRGAGPPLALAADGPDAVVAS